MTSAPGDSSRGRSLRRAVGDQLRGAHARLAALLRDRLAPSGALLTDWLEAGSSQGLAAVLLDQLLAHPRAIPGPERTRVLEGLERIHSSGLARHEAEARLSTALGYFQEPFRQLARWALLSQETTNFTYPLAPLNVDYLAAFLAVVTGEPEARCRGYMDELEQDQELREHLRRRARESRLPGDEEPRYGRRLGWYALVRLCRPRLVVETGVHRGLGTCVLAAALRRNAAEGAPGRVLGTDIDPAAGALLALPYSDQGEVHHGDSLATLRALRDPIDLFVNDSDHRASYEAEEYATIEPRLTADALVLSDNAHCTGELLAFARRTGRRFLFFAERPADHWYPGAGIGVAFPAPAARA